jgi:hypothetical protein
MESRDEAAPSHRTWKTPMKLAFPTAPTAPAAEEKEQTRKQQTALPWYLRKPSSMSSVSVLDVLVRTEP